MKHNIYVRRGDEQFGPFDRETLLNLVSQGQFTLQDLAWHDTLGDEWKPLAQVLKLTADEVKAVAAVPSAQQAANGLAGSALQQEVVITGVKIGFVDLAVLIFKVWMASIPAMIVLWIIMAIIMGIVSALFGGLFFLHSTDSH